MIRRSILLTALGFLAACDGGGTGTTIALDAGNGDEAVTTDADAQTGRISIDAPGLKASMSLPKTYLDADDMDVGGVKLFPGSTIESINVLGAAESEDSVEIGFDAPAAQADVGKWFDAQLRQAGYAVTSADNGLSGTNSRNETIRVEMAASGARTHGTIVVQGRD